MCWKNPPVNWYKLVHAFCYSEERVRIIARDNSVIVLKWYDLLKPGNQVRLFSPTREQLIRKLYFKVKLAERVRPVWDPSRIAVEISETNLKLKGIVSMTPNESVEYQEQFLLEVQRHL